jgi:hypothetical protein
MLFFVTIQQGDRKGKISFFILSLPLKKGFVLGKNRKTCFAKKKLGRQ